MRKDGFISWFNPIVALASLILLAACEKEPESLRDYPGIRTLKVENRSEGGVVFYAEIIHREGIPIKEYGFAWDTIQNLTLEKSDRRSMNGMINGETYSAFVPTSFVEDLDYYVRAYLKSEDYLVYGNYVPFTVKNSTSASISSFFPTSGYRGDTITILGEHFSYLNTQVSFGSASAELISQSDSMVRVLVPACLQEELSRISVTIAGKTVSSRDEFQMIPTMITSFYPEIGSENDLIEIHGEGFNSQIMEVRLGNGILAEILAITPGTITVQLPEKVGESGANPIQMSNGCTTISSSSDFLLEGAQINEFSHQSGILGVSVISATGSNFSLRPDDYTMIVNGAEVELYMKDLNENQVSFYLPGTVQPGKYQISLKVDGKAYIHPFEFEFISPWSRKSDMPVEHFGTYGSTFVLGENIYFANGIEHLDTDFWMFDPSRNYWERKSDIPGPSYSKRIAFTINGIGYLGTGKYHSSVSASCEFYTYDPESDTWQFIGFMDSTEYNGGYFGSIAFSTEEKGYLFGGAAQGDWKIYSETKYWEFTPQINQWQSLGDFYGFEEISQLVSPAGFIINNKFYMGVGRIWNDEYTTKFWEYDPITDHWREISEFPGVPRIGAVGFALDGKGYVGLGESEDNEALNDFWVYSPETDQWRRTADFEGPPREGAVSAVVRNRAYVGMSGFGNDLWEFNPETL